MQSEATVTQLDGSLGSAESGSTGTVQKYESVVPTMVFGQNDEYRGGLLSRTGAPERSVRLEFAVNDGGKWMPELEYVDRGTARESYPSSKGEAPTQEQVPSYTRDLGHDGVSLHEFWRRQPLTGSDRVTVVEVAVLRAYTGPWFVAINFYLRYLPVADCCMRRRTGYRVPRTQKKKQ